jgi:Skp family chaperone for outer membrane proteins
MPATQASAIALHVEAAKRLLQELALHADSAMSVLGQESGNEFFAAVDERGRILAELDAVVDALAHARAMAGPGAHREIEATQLNEMARAAAAALESQEQLLLRTRQERDRLAQALKATKRTDSIASHYTAASTAGRARTLSVTG